MQNQRDDDEHAEGAESKAKLRTSKDVYARLQWDATYDPAHYILGYTDRFDGMMEMPLAQFKSIDEGGDVPWQRIHYFKDARTGEKVWDRDQRFDLVFRSGETDKILAKRAADAEREAAAELDEQGSSSSARSGDRNKRIVTPKSNSTSSSKIRVVNRYKVIKGKGATQRIDPTFKSDYHIIDVTSESADEKWRRFSPFYPHSNIPIPLSSSSSSPIAGKSVEGIWQGLKVFENEGVDVSCFANESMKNVKRRAGKNGRGKLLGHSRGVPPSSDPSDRDRGHVPPLLSYIEARVKIYLPAYEHVLQNDLKDLVAELKATVDRGDKPIALLDFETNCELSDPNKPLSHAALIKRYLEDDWWTDDQLDEAIARGKSGNADRPLPQRGRQPRQPRNAKNAENAGNQPAKRGIAVGENAKGMPVVKSCGVLVFMRSNSDNELRFLLLKHPNRYDLPKGHLENGETEMECALRELNEETGIEADSLMIDDRVLHTEVYYPTYKRFGNRKVEKSLVMYVAFVRRASTRDVDTPLVALTEHEGFEWMTWNPPHAIQKNTIDPLLAKAELRLAEIVDRYGADDVNSALDAMEREFESKRDRREEEEADDGDEEEDEDEEQEASTMEKGVPVSRKRRGLRRKRTILSQAGYSMMDKAPGPGGNVSLTDERGEQIVFSEKALTTHAKLVVKRNYRRNLTAKAAGDRVNDDDDEDDADDNDEELSAMEKKYRPPPQSQLGAFLVAGRAARDGGDGKEWACDACTFLNPSSATFSCSVCNTPRGQAARQ